MNQKSKPSSSPYRSLCLVTVVLLFVGCISFEDTRLRVGVGYDHRQGSTEGSQQFWPSATVRVDEDPIYRGWVEIDFPFGTPAKRSIVIENWRDLKPDPVPGTTVIHSAPAHSDHKDDAPTLVLPEAKTIKIFGSEFPADTVTLAIILSFGLPAIVIGCIIFLFYLKSKRREDQRDS